MAANPKKFDCEKCLHKHCDDNNPASVAIHVVVSHGINFETKTCLLPMITGTSRLMLKLYNHYKNNILPFQGGLLEQPAVYVDSMELLESVYNEIAANG